jgi:hypothetical protein
VPRLGPKPSVLCIRGRRLTTVHAGRILLLRAHLCYLVGIGCEPRPSLAAARPLFWWGKRDNKGIVGQGVGVDGCGGVALSAARSGRPCKTDDPPRSRARVLRVRTPCLPFFVFALCDVSARLACVAGLLVYGVLQWTCDWLDTQRERRPDDIKTATMHWGPSHSLHSFPLAIHPIRPHGGGIAGVVYLPLLDNRRCPACPTPSPPTLSEPAPAPASPPAFPATASDLRHRQPSYSSSYRLPSLQTPDP